MDPKRFYLARIARKSSTLFFAWSKASSASKMTYLSFIFSISAFMFETILRTSSFIALYKKLAITSSYCHHLTCSLLVLLGTDDCEWDDSLDWDFCFVLCLPVDETVSAVVCCEGTKSKTASDSFFPRTSQETLAADDFERFLSRVWLSYLYNTGDLVLNDLFEITSSSSYNL